jgi:putative methyltransferase (TIGR04325 family)
VAANSNRLSVIDFGGSLGTTYQQNRRFLSKLKNSVEWHIVEQENVCVLAKNFLTHERNLFYYSDLVKIKTDVDIIIFSSSIQYIKEFSDIIIKAKDLRPKYIIFLKTPINKTPFNLIFVQKIPGKIYEGSYPSWAFSSDCINDILRLDYNLIIKEKVEPKLFFVNHYDFFYELVV